MFDVKVLGTFKSNQFLPPLEKPTRIWREVGTTLVIASIASRDQDSIQSAAEALIAAIHNGTLPHQLLISVTRQLIDDRFAKPARLADGLKVVASVSEFHQLVLLDALSRALVEIDPFPKGIHALLELLRDWYHDLGFGPSENLVERLCRVKTKGKTGKLIKEICALEGSVEPIYWRVNQQVIEQRLGLLEDK